MRDGTISLIYTTTVLQGDENTSAGWYPFERLRHFPFHKPQKGICSVSIWRVHKLARHLRDLKCIFLTLRTPSTSWVFVYLVVLMDWTRWNKEIYLVYCVNAWSWSYNQSEIFSLSWTSPLHWGQVQSYLFLIEYCVWLRNMQH